MKIKIITGWFFLLLLVSTVIAEKTAEQAFTEIYDKAIWGHGPDGKGFSGSGSSVKNAKIYMQFLQKFLKDNNIKSVVDVGCGDWTFSQYIDWSGINYIGYDVVKSVIEMNKRRFSGQNFQFIMGDALNTNLPAADLLICKDVLQHLPNSDILLFLKQCSKFKHCLITNDCDPKTGTSSNRDISFRGDCRPIDLIQAPFFVKGFKVLSYNSGKSDKKQVLHISKF